MELFEKYDFELKSARSSYDNSKHVNKILTCSDKKMMYAFWIAFSAQGSFITAPVENWILRAGQACNEHGYSELGEQLIKHSAQEKNHHLLMLNDLNNLIAIWNDNYPEKLHIKQTSEQPESSAPYYNLHEEAINSKSPYKQIAIEYEIENLSLSHGELILKNTLSMFGAAFKKNISFIFSHVKFDVEHTKFNANQLELFLNKFPTATNDLIDAGKSALQAYLTHMEACITSAAKYVSGEERNVICLAT